MSVPSLNYFAHHGGYFASQTILPAALVYQYYRNGGACQVHPTLAGDFLGFYFRLFADFFCF